MMFGHIQKELPMSFQIKILKAAHGDCIVIRGIFDGNIPRNILIDGGPSKAYKYRQFKGELLKELESIQSSNQVIDLLILSHVDDDHIGGLLKGFKSDGLLTQLTQKVWFNSGKLIFDHFDKEPDESNLLAMGNVEPAGDGYTSIGQGVTFESYIEDKNIWERNLILEGQEKKEFGAKFSFLSPTEDKLKKLLIKWEKERPESLTSGRNTDYDKSFSELLDSDEFQEDNSIHNGSSIAFIFEYGERRILLLGDAHDSVVVESLKNRIESGESNKFELVKLSHHGSKYNTSTDFLNLIDCDNYVVSTDASKHGLPNKTTLARIYASNPKANVFFNYPEIAKSKVFTSSELTELAGTEFTISSSDTVF